MKLFSPFLLPAIVVTCLSGTAHAHPLLSPTAQVFQESAATPPLALLTEPLSVPLGIIGGLGALLLLRPRRRR